MRRGRECRKQPLFFAKAALKRLGPIMRYLLRDDAPVLSVWERARRVERSPTPRSVPEVERADVIVGPPAENVVSASV